METTQTPEEVLRKARLVHYRDGNICKLKMIVPATPLPIAPTARIVVGPVREPATS